jgi:integral membrane protein (TIGR01906 family)
MDTLGRRAATLLIAAATALGILTASIPLFLNPVWVAFEQGRAEATAWTGYSEPQLRAATDAILADLVLGPPAFDVEVAGAPVLNERERGHMRDVRSVFGGFFLVTLVLVVAAVVVARRRPRIALRAVRDGAIALAVGLVAAGAIALVAFDVLFEVFHRLLFPAGSYTFDPSTERLVQLFPFRFWQETAIALGLVAIVLAAVVALVTQRRLRAGRAATPRTALALDRGR